MKSAKRIEERKRTRGERATERLKAMLWSGKIAPGARISERELARALRMSRTPVRQAIHHLIQMGLFEPRARDGTYVRELAVDEFRQVMEVRAALEGVAAALAAQRIPEKTLADLDRIARVIDGDQLAALGNPDRAPSRGNLKRDFRFHWMIAENSGNPRLGRLLEDQRLLQSCLQASVSLLRRFFRPDPEYAFGSHAAVVAALRQGSAKAAERMVRRHILGPSGSVLDRYELNGELNRLGNTTSGTAGGRVPLVKSNETATRKKTMGERATERLLAMLWSGKIVPGARISEGELARAMRMSRTPVRQAIHRLIQLGLFDSRNGAGTWVRRITADDYQQRRMIRMALEGMAAGLASTRLSDRELDKLDRLARRLELRFRRPDSVATNKTDIQFHRIIAESSGNPRLCRLLDDQMVIASCFWLGAHQETNVNAKQGVDHLKIVAALRSRSPAVAEEQMRRHVIGIWPPPRSPARA